MSVFDELNSNQEIYEYNTERIKTKAKTTI